MVLILDEHLLNYVKNELYTSLSGEHTFRERLEFSDTELALRSLEHTSALAMVRTQQRSLEFD